MSKIKRTISKIITKINSDAPCGYIGCAKSWVDTWNQAHMNLRAMQPVAWYENLESPVSKFVDFSTITPATSEDRLMKASISWNAHTRSPSKDLFSILGARILGRDGAIISPDGRMFCEFTYNSGGYLDHPIFLQRRIPKIVHRQGNYTSLVYPDSSNYYHWLIESLPNLRFLDKILPTLDGIFVPQLKRFHLESLEALGIHRDRLMPIDFNSHFQCDRFYLPSFSNGYNVTPEIVGWLQNAFLPAARQKPGKKLFISRQDTGSRRVTNETEVMSLLAPLGYELVELSALGFIEQAILFNEAESVIAPHGAGLANLAFCSAGTKVLEIFPARWTPCCYLQLALAARLDYHFMISEPMGASINEYPQYHGFEPVDKDAPKRDIEIPLDKLDFFCNRN